jgi:hypothetical protein
MKVLVVGAGVVGQVYGHHLATGGAEVTFLVKPEHAAALEGGATLYPLNRRRKTSPVSFTDFRLLTDVTAVAGQRWNHVYLAMSSTGLRAGDWFRTLAAGLGHATLVLLQPGPDDRRFVEAHVAPEAIVQGIITLIGYQAPLPGEARFPRPGVAYWFPPLASSPLSGPRAREVVAALRGGGLPARRIADAGPMAAFGTALMMPLLAALERAGWTFGGLRGSGLLPAASRAAGEALEVMAHHQRRRAPWPLRAFHHPLLIRTALAMLPRLMPFDLEAYLRAHFTKVGDQTRDLLHTYRALGEHAGLPTDGLAQLTA